MVCRTGTPVAAALLLTFTATAQDAEAKTGRPTDDHDYTAVDYAKLDRTIRKQPVFTSEPLYALFLFGPEGEAKMWAALDKSDAKLLWSEARSSARRAMSR